MVFPLKLVREDPCKSVVDFALCLVPHVHVPPLNVNVGRVAPMVRFQLHGYLRCAAHRSGARTVQKLHQKLDEFIAAVQFGVTLSSLALGWIGEAAMAHVLEPLFSHLPHSRFYAHGFSIAFAFILITYMHVILGEIVPKSLALQRTEAVALAVAGPMDVFMTLAAPLLAVMTASSRVVLKAFGARQVREGGVHSPEEL